MNIIYNSDGRYSLKDTTQLKKVFESDEAMAHHIEAIIQIAVEGGYDGIEMDYEAMRKDWDLWEKYTVFCERLYNAA